MCFFVRQSQDATSLENRFKASILEKDFFKQSTYINAFTYPHLPIISNREPNIIQHYRWGLVPLWAKDDQIKQYTLNAKIETLSEKPSFRSSLNKRCLILVDGFYEWQWLDPKGKQKQKYIITLPNNEPFALGGLWSYWEDKLTGNILNTFTIVTTAANELMSQIHNSKKRMPVILDKNNEKEWLNSTDILNFAYGSNVKLLAEISN